jgi:hypothetical protein
VTTRTRTPEELQDLRTRARAADHDDDPILVVIDDPSSSAHRERAELLDVNDDGSFEVEVAVDGRRYTVCDVEEARR